MYDERFSFRPLAQTQIELLVARMGAYLDLGRFTYAELEADLAHCRSSLTVTTFKDALGVPEQERVVTLAASDQPGSAPTPLSVEIPRDGSLTLGGEVHALQCPEGSLGVDRLVVRVGGVEIDSRTLHGEWFAADTEPFDLVLTETMTRALLDAEAESSFTVEVLREGEACLGRFSGSLRLYAIEVNVRGSQAAPPAVAGFYSGTTTQTNMGAFPATASVVQSLDGKTISVLGLQTAELGFSLGPDGTLGFLGRAPQGVERDGRGMPVAWEEYFWRFEGTIIGKRFDLTGYFPTDYLAQRWELDRP
jgi:hypothetical protein